MNSLKALLCKFTFIVSVLLTACASPQESGYDVTELQFEQVAHQPIHSSKHDVRANLGEPSEVVEAKNPTEEETWIYKTGEVVRTMLGFSPSSGLLISKIFQVGELDSEKSIQVALSRFPSANFRKKNAKLANPHFATDETWYEDKALGVLITTRRMRNEVVAISWHGPGTH